jgi:hypothetical protein
MPTFISRRCLTVGVIASSVLASGCLSKAITKEEAAQLVRGSTAFTRPKFAHIPRLLTFQGYFSSPYGEEGILSISQIARIDPTVAILKLARDVEVNESIYGPGRGAMHHLTISPTGIDSTLLMADAAPNVQDPQENIDAQDERPPVNAWGWNTVHRELGWRVPIGTRELLHVDQIHNWKDANENIPVNELAVDFSWRWVPNELGDAFDSESETFKDMPDSVQQAAWSFGARMNTAATMQSRAYLHREGDRWKLRLIQWSYGRGNPR